MSYIGVDAFLDDLSMTCKTHKVVLKFSKSKTVEVEKGIRSSGYFDYSRREIAIGKNREDWLQLLVHESAHMDQWIEDTKVWKADEHVGSQLLDKWILGKEVSRLRTAVNNIINLELDCEKRASRIRGRLDKKESVTLGEVDYHNKYLEMVQKYWASKKIIEYDLPINTVTYIQKANACLMYYNYLYKTRRWVPGSFEHRVWSHFPGKFMPIRYYRKLTPEADRIFKKVGL